MKKIIYWIASIFCFILLIIASIVVLGLFKFLSSSVLAFSSLFLPLFLFILPPIVFLFCGLFYLSFALGKKESNLVTKISLFSLFLIPPVLFILFYILKTSIMRSSTDAMQGLGVLALIIGVYGTFSLLQFILTLIGFLTSKKKQAEKRPTKKYLSPFKLQ